MKYFRVCLWCLIVPFVLYAEVCALLLRGYEIFGSWLMTGQAPIVRYYGAWKPYALKIKDILNDDIGYKCEELSRRRIKDYIHSRENK